jgi:hypothetical protein
MAEYIEFPRVRYTADGPVTVMDQAEMDALDGEHFDLPTLENHPDDYNPATAHEANILPSGHVHHEYPKMMRDQATIVHDEDEEAAWRAANPEDEEEAEKPAPAPKAAPAPKPATTPKPPKPPKAKASTDASDLI